jgi:hypothetical protein
MDVIRAVLSDVYSNLPALQAVLSDIESAGATEIVCLGNVVGLGPNPVDCLALLLERSQVFLKGHMERCLLGEVEPAGFRNLAALDWHRNQLVPGILSWPTKRRRWEAIRSAPRVHRVDGWTFCHTSPAEWDCGVPLYPLNMGSTTQDEHRENFSTFERALLTGASRGTFVFDEQIATLPRDELFVTQVWRDGLESVQVPIEGKTVVHVGSVGRPGDRDPRACYVLVEGSTVTWRRVEYDVEETIQASEGLPLHPNYSAWLREGI